MNRYLLNLEKEYLPIFESLLNAPIEFTSLGESLYLVDTTATAEALQKAVFPRYVLPIEYQWPYHQEDFVERASRGLLKKFESKLPRNCEIFSPQQGLKSLSVNLKGRLCQLLPKNGTEESIHCCLTPKVLYAGVTTPKKCGNVVAGGRKFVKLSGDDFISRAAAKAVEALDVLARHDIPVKKGSTWCDLGAAPGGVAQELLQRELKVIAVDRAPLDKKIASHPELKFWQGDVDEFSLDVKVDGIFCDLNGDPILNLQRVTKISKALNAGGVLIHTLKLADMEKLEEYLGEARKILKAHHLNLFDVRHLYHNRSEVTLFAKVGRE